LSHCFLERLCQFRHRDCRLLAGKYVVVVGTGALEPAVPAAMIEKMLPYYQMHHLGSVTAQGAASCFTCGSGETCGVGAVRMMHGPGVVIRQEIIPDLGRQPDKIAEARALGEKMTVALHGAR
jgi:hypothetical protein